MSLKPKKQAHRALPYETTPQGLSIDQQPLLCSQDQGSLTSENTLQDIH